MDETFQRLIRELTLEVLAPDYKSGVLYFVEHSTEEKCALIPVDFHVEFNSKASAPLRHWGPASTSYGRVEPPTISFKLDANETSKKFLKKHLDIISEVFPKESAKMDLLYIKDKEGLQIQYMFYGFQITSVELEEFDNSPLGVTGSCDYFTNHTEL